MSDLPMIKTAAGWVVDLMPLEVGDLIVVQCDAWPHNYSSLDFSQTETRQTELVKNVYHAVVNYRPNQGMTIAQFNEPKVVVFKHTPKA